MSGSSIAIYIGAPYTNGERVAWSLRKDGRKLVDEGLLIRRPGTYQKMIKAARGALFDGELSEEKRQSILQKVTRGRDVSRLVLSDGTFIGERAWMLHKGGLFKNAGRNTQKLRNLFREHEVEFFLSIRNPATLIPEAFHGQDSRTLEAFLSDADLLMLRWSSVIRDILEANPESPLTVWCNEETPVIWPSILQAVAGFGADYRLEGEMDIIQDVLKDEGVKRLNDYLAERPWLNENQRKGIYAVFLNRFYAEEHVEEEIDLPGWSQDLVDEMTEIYSDDLKLIKNMREVRFISGE